MGLYTSWWAKIINAYLYFTDATKWIVVKIIQAVSNKVSLKILKLACISVMLYIRNKMVPHWCQILIMCL